MANIKSAKKRVLVNVKKNEQNISIKSDLKTAIKKLKGTITTGKKADAQAQLSDVFAKLDHAADINVIHANKAANNKASLAKAIDKMEK